MTKDHKPYKPRKKLSRQKKRDNIQNSLIGISLQDKTWEILMRPLDDKFIRYKRCG